MRCRCYTEVSAGAYRTYVGRTRSRVEGSGRTYAEETKSSTVVEVERHTGVLWGERPRLEKEVKLRSILRETQTIYVHGNNSYGRSRESPRQ